MNERDLRTKPQTRLGILGGTFNPVHIGHLILAQNAMEIFDLAKVLFVPCDNPPHKGRSMLLEPRHRLAMLEHALEGELRFDVCDVEIERGGISYTVDTLTELEQRYPDTSLHFIVGTDTLTELHTWKDIYRILDMCTFVSLCRPGADVSRISRESLHLDPPWPDRLLANVATGRLIDVSSSDIRYRVAEGLSIRYLVPDAVEMYIAEHGLYT
ncbi:MAG: nicotinate-nucleotide adenylyltransferase [Kiritimatiellia bacterium]|nr:nicotinate-nucleotide adenylyltransferase [Kiritimatiellia bacterium]MDP6847392.1 nicotinate-nucleotide adenylyltransferase [Kiritimatiellia bacterium]